MLAYIKPAYILSEADLYTSLAESTNERPIFAPDAIYVDQRFKQNRQRVWNFFPVSKKRDGRPATRRQNLWNQSLESICS